MKITVVLHNIRSVYNVGAILRTCDGLGAEKAVFSGYTPRYDDPELLPHLRAKLNRQIEKSALGAEKSVPRLNLPQNNRDSQAKEQTEVALPSNGETYASSLTNYIKYAITEGYAVIGLENNLSPEELPKRLILGQKLTKNAKNGQKSPISDKILLILGEEVHGIPPEIRSEVDYFLEIPMRGQKESFNVSVAAGIALWGLMNYT